MKRKGKSSPKFQGPETFDGRKQRRDEPTPEFSGFKARMRLDRPGRKFGGRVGADLSPLSSAAKRCD